jgi:hypothetical protein
MQMADMIRPVGRYCMSVSVKQSFIKKAVLLPSDPIFMC